MKNLFFASAFLGASLAASSALADVTYDLVTVLDNDTIGVDVPSDAGWFGVAAGYSGFVTAFDDQNGDRAIWRAMLTCEAELGGCDATGTIEVDSDDSLAVAYCVNRNFQPTAGIAAHGGVEEAAEEAMGVAENTIIESRPQFIDLDWDDEDNYIAAVCSSVVFSLNR